MNASADRLIWIDLEMTGLNPNRDYIIEIATLVTDPVLKELGQGPVLALRQNEAVLAGMDEWNTSHHSRSGLLERVRREGIDTREAERRTLDFLRPLVPPQASPMCGNSICQDRRFLARLMPELEAYFHYRNLDVSTIKELYQRWVPNGPHFEKDSAHRALEDIRDSVEELRFYRKHFLNGGR